MRKIILLFTGLLFIAASYASVNVIEPKEPRLNASEIFFPVGNSGKQISLWDLSRISRHELEDLTGERMTFMEKIAFKKTQKTLKKEINPDGTINSKKLEKFFQKRDGETGFHLGGFVLGFFGTPILFGFGGVLIAYLINDDYKKNRVKWAWIGLGTAVLLVILLGLLLCGFDGCSFGG